MLLDKQNIFSDSQSITISTYSSNTINFGKTDVSYVPVIVQVVSDFAGLTSLTVEVETSAVSNFATYTSLCSTTLPLAKLTAGAKFPITHLPKGNLGYMRLKYVVSGTGTAGKITAGVVASDELSYHEL